jgi:hypothetical protein
MIEVSIKETSVASIDTYQVVFSGMTWQDITHLEKIILEATWGLSDIYINYSDALRKCEQEK